MSNPWDIVILGCGQLGGNLKTELEAEKFRVLGVRRSSVTHDSHFLSLDLDNADSWAEIAQLSLSDRAVIIAIVTPDARNESAYRHRYVGVSERLREFISRSNRELPVIWVSSTAVFGTDQEGHLAEAVSPEPNHWRGDIVREAEHHIEQIQSPTTIIRFAGLYSTQSFTRMTDQDFRTQLNPETVSNRMHRADAVRWLRFLILAHQRKMSVPALVHGVDEGSATYQAIFDVIDGRTRELVTAHTGRVIATQYRDLMPPLSYPTCLAAIR